MTAINHALTGALIGVAVGNPWIALPVAFLSHFVCDALPHYDVPGDTHEARIASRLFWQVHIVGGALLCMALVAILAIWQPVHWLLASFCAFAAASPDLLAIPRFISVRRTGKDIRDRWWFWRFHNVVQWFQEPVGLVVEAAWFAGMIILLVPFFR